MSRAISSLAVVLLSAVATWGESTRAAAAVVVAVAVDELLQTKLPMLPDTLPDRDQSTGATLRIDDAALDQITARQKIVVTVASPASFACGHCDAMKADATKRGWLNGDADIDLKWITMDVPGATGYPWITSPGRMTIYGRTDLAGLRQWLGLPAVKPAQAIGGVTVGTIRARESIDQIFNAIRHSPNGCGVQFGQVIVNIPAQMQQTVDLDGSRLRIVFSGTKPTVSYGSGWLKVARSVSSVTMTRELLTVGVDGFPDLALRTE